MLDVYATYKLFGVEPSEDTIKTFNSVRTSLLFSTLCAEQRKPCYSVEGKVPKITSCRVVIRIPPFWRIAWARIFFPVAK